VIRVEGISATLCCECEQYRPRSGLVVCKLQYRRPSTCEPTTTLVYVYVSLRS